ncbi:TonB-dependent receptor domain-containing protein [Candidatus Methylobacter oryzae]|uniref:TonB-dependent receptor n=1 Tax=Candidatus Methylobacter oryzae TaxID=2497749 RepID=A0ABY3CF04_9GAMM|nr:TonB-dependent receptor [Candidatus Methylobacter oryzae]TRW96156.1 TonB-dependent receptor [Candidatus Methylobacter oryzae]
MQKLIFGSLLLTGFNSQLHAQETVQNLPDIVVTATRTETAKNQLAAAATVYTRKDIERLQAKTLPELLSGTTGVDMSQSGGYGKDTNLYMRGTNSDHVLVLLDGIKIGSVTSGTTPFQLIPLDQVERVEIIRGPQSSLYGSEAIGGVIQIFTRKGSQNEKPSVTLDAGGGTYDTYRASGSVSGQWKNSWYTLASSQFGSQGFNSRQPTPGPFGINQPDKDGYLNTALNARLGHRFDNNAEVEAFFMRAEGKNEYDGSFQNKTEFIEQTVGATAGMNIAENWRSMLRFGQSRDEGDNFAPDGSFSSRFNSTRWNASWLNEVALSDNHQLVIGSDYRLDQVDSSTAYNETSRYDAGIFTELHSRILDAHFFNASVRGDKNEAFGEQVTGNFGWRYHWNYGISPFASFGNAFKAPTFNQLYFPGFGNPSLKAEQSTSFEAGLAGDHDWLQWELRGYHTNIDNLIVTVTNPATFLASAENVGKAQIDGIEAEIGTQLLGWNGKLNMNLLSPKNRESDLRLPRRADKTLSFDLSRSCGQFDLGGAVLAQGERFDDAQNKTKVAGYVTVDLRSAYHLNKNWMLSAKLNNLLDKQYQTINTYNTAGRNFFLSIHYNN